MNLHIGMHKTHRVQIITVGIFIFKIHLYGANIVAQQAKLWSASLTTPAQIPTVLLHFQSNSKLTYPGKQQRTAQGIGPLNSHRKARHGACLLALDWPSRALTAAAVCGINQQVEDLSLLQSLSP